MRIGYLTRSYQATDSVRAFTEKKLQKVLRFLEEPLDIQVNLEVEKHRHTADLHIAHRFGVIQAREETSEMLDSINRAADKAKKQAKRSRKKHKDRKRRARSNGREWPLAVVDRSTLGEAEGPKIIRTAQLTIKPMTLEEAALSLEESEVGIIVFRDAGNDRVSVLFKRSDDNYGLISPEM
jgi:putative sigma-54 modulation protein